jgi:hypothetical protein
MKCEGGPADEIDITLDPPGEHFCIVLRKPAGTHHYMSLGGVFLYTISEPFRDDIKEDGDLARQLVESGRFGR